MSFLVGRYSEDNPCYGVGWLREHYTAFGIEKVGSREVEVMTSHCAYERVRYNNTDMYYDKYVGRKHEPKTVKQFIYRMTDAQGAQMLSTITRKKFVARLTEWRHVSKTTKSILKSSRRCFNR